MGAKNECDNVDECKTGPDKCDLNADCIDTEGSFECHCIDGWTGDGINCYDVDECNSANHTCTDDETCQNIEGKRLKTK